MEELQRFILAAQIGNLTKAAEKLFITQSALTQSVHRLEKQIGAKLFTQKGKYLELTPDGQALIAIGGKILELWQKARDPQIRKAIKPTITIGMFDDAALRLAKFVQKNTPAANFDIEFTIDRSGKLLSDLRLGVIDIAITVISPKHEPTDITTIKTFEEQLIPVSSITFKTPLDQIPFILYNKGSNTRDQIDEVFTKKGIAPKIYAESTSSAFMKELALLGTGVALLPENAVKQELKQKRLIKQPLPLIWPRRYGIYIHKNTKSEELMKLTEDLTQILTKT